MAVTIHAYDLAKRIRGAAADNYTATALLAVATARVEREAPDAPEAVQNEAVVRYAGYLAQSDFGTIRQESIGPKETQYIVDHQRAWIRCGAKAILSPWKPLHLASAVNGSGDE